MAEGMARLFQELGGDLRTSSPVEEIVVRRGRAKGVIVDGAFYPADAVVCAADFPYAMKHLVCLLYTSAPLSKAACARSPKAHRSPVRAR